MGNSPPITAQVRQQLEDFAEVEERDLLLKIEKTIERTPLKYLFEKCPLHYQAVNALILHVQVFVERIFDFSRSLELGQPVEQMVSDALNRAVVVLMNLHGVFEKFGFPQESAQKFKTLELRNADLFLPNLMERLKAGLESKVNNAVPSPQGNQGTSVGKNHTKSKAAPPVMPNKPDSSRDFDAPRSDFSSKAQGPLTTEGNSFEQQIVTIISQCAILGDLRVLPDELQPELSFAFRKLARKMVEAEADVICAFPPQEFRDRLRVRVPEIRSACMEAFYRLTKGVATREGSSDPGSAAGNLRVWIAGAIDDAVRWKVDELTAEPDEELSAEAQLVIRNKLDAATAVVKSAVEGVADGTTDLEEAARQLEWQALLWAYDYFHEILNQWSLKGIPPTKFDFLAKTKADEVAEYAADP